MTEGTPTCPRRWLAAKFPIRFQAMLWLGTALAVRVAHYAFVRDSPLSLAPTSDEFEHYRLALHLASGDWLGREWGAYHRPQLFAYFWALLLRLSRGNLDFCHAALMLADSAGVAMLWLAARRILTRQAAFWGALAAVSYWPFVHFASTFYMESFALMIQAAMLWAFVEGGVRLMKARENHKKHDGSEAPAPPPGLPPQGIPPQIAWAGGLTGLALLTRPTVSIALPWMLAMLAWAAWRGRDSLGRAIAAPALFMAILIAVLLPNAVRNYKVSGQWIWYSSNGALNFYLGNNDRGIDWMTCSPGIEWTLFIETPAIEEGIGQDRAARVDFWRRRSIEYLHRAPIHFAKNLFVKFLAVWNARSVHCTNNFEEMDRLSPVQLFLPGFDFWGTFGLAGMILCMVRWARTWRRGDGLPCLAAQRQWGQVFLAGYVLLYLFGVAMFLAVERHRLPPVAPLFLFGGVIVTEIAAAYKARRRTHVAWGIGAIAAAMIFTGLPLAGPAVLHHERYWTQVNLGTAEKALARQDEPANTQTHYDRARKHFLAAHEWLPARLEPVRQLANLAEQRKSFEEAARWQRRLIELMARTAPNYRAGLAEETAHLVVLLLSWGKPEAEAPIRAAARNLAQIAPASADAQHLSGAAFMAIGDITPARDHFRRTLQIDPSNHSARENLRRLDAETSPSAAISPGAATSPDAMTSFPNAARPIPASSGHSPSSGLPR